MTQIENWKMNNYSHEWQLIHIRDIKNTVTIKSLTTAHIWGKEPLFKLCFVSCVQTLVMHFTLYFNPDSHICMLDS